MKASVGMWLLALLALGLLAACSDEVEPTQQEEIAATKADLSKFQDVTVADDNGYVFDIGALFPLPPGVKNFCADGQSFGAMGVHFIAVNPVTFQFVFEGTDPKKPTVLLYDTVWDGVSTYPDHTLTHGVNHASLDGFTFELIAAEWFQTLIGPNGPIFVEADLAGVDLASFESSRPRMFQQPFNGPMWGHECGQPLHFDMHVWLWRENPAGIFDDFNRNVQCSTANLPVLPILSQPTLQPLAPPC